MLFKLCSPTTFRSTFLLLSLSLFIAINLLYSFGAIPYRIPFVWSTQSSTKLELAPHPSVINNASCNIPQPSSYPLQPPEEPHLHKQLRRYIAFHAEARACLLNPACKQTPRILVARCSSHRGCSGLGDRMRGLLFSFTIAVITKRVLFLHNLSKPFPLQQGVVPYAVDWTLPSTVHYNDSWPHLEWNYCRKGRKCTAGGPAITDFENFDNVGPGINMLTDDIVKLFGDKPVVSITSRNRYHRVSFIHQNPYLKDRFGGLAKYILEGNFNWYRLLFQPALPTKQVMKRVEFMDDFISVHIRTGVDVNETNNERFLYWSSHEEERVESVLRCMEKVTKNVTNIFLASDSVNTKEIFKKKAQERGYEVHLFEKKTIHYGKIPGVIRKEHWDAACEGFLTVFSDLFMLSRGKTMIKTGSHFSKMAWLLSEGQRAFQSDPNGECNLLKRRSS